MGPERLKVMERWNLLFAAVGTGVALAFAELPVALGFALGSALACVNFWSIRRIWSSLLAAPSEVGSRRQAMQMLFLFKTVALVVAVFLVLRFLPISPVGFAMGISIFLLSIAVESARFALCGPASERQRS